MPCSHADFPSVIFTIDLEVGETKTLLIFVLYSVYVHFRLQDQDNFPFLLYTKTKEEMI